MNIIQLTNGRLIPKVIFIFLGFLMLVGSFSVSFADDGNDEKELFLVAQKAFDDGFYDVAIRYIDQYLQSYPQAKKRTQAKLLLGQCFFFKSQYLKAFETFQELMQVSEFKDATLFWIGETYFKGSDYKEAIKHYQQLIELYPDSVYVPQAFYSLAWTYFDQGDYEKAKNYLLTLVTQFPAHELSEDAAFKLGECEHNLGLYDSAKDYFLKYIYKYPLSTRHAEAFFYVAESYYYLEDYLTAITYYAKSANIAYDAKIKYMANVSMGWSYLKLDRFELSQRYFDEAKALAEGKDIISDDIYLGQASLYAETQQHQKALEAYEALIEQFPNSHRIAEARLGKANIDYILENYQEAIAGYHWIINSYAQDTLKQDTLEKAYYGLAWTYLKSGDIDASIKSFESIMNKTKSEIVKVSALTQIGDAYLEIDKPQKAIEIYDLILKDHTDSIYADYAQFKQGIALLKLKKFEAASLSFKSLQVNFPNSKHLSDVEYYLGLLYFKKEDWSQAISHINTYLEKKKDASLGSNSLASEAYYILGLSYFNLGNYQQAIVLFEKLAKDYPEQRTMKRTADLNIAKCLYYLGRTNESLQKFKMINILYPNTETAQDSILWLADHYLESGELDNAIFFYQQFIKKFPGSHKLDLIRYELGQAFQAKGQLDQALNYYKLINETSENKKIYAKAKLTIADIFSEEADPKIAIEKYLHIAKTVPDFQRDAYMKIAYIHKQNNEYESALQSYNQALDAPKAMSAISDAQIQFYIGDAFEILNKPQEAIDAYMKIPYLYEEDVPWIIKAYLRIARIFEDTEKWQEAKLTYGKIMSHKTEESKYAIERINWINQNILNQYHLAK